MLSPKISSRATCARPMQDGFTIIEVLVTISLLSIVVVLVLSQLTGLFGMSRRSGDQVTGTNAVQGVIEQIKGEWQSQSKYDGACISATSLPTGVSATLQDYTLSDDSSGAGTTTASGTSYSLALQGSGCGGTATSTVPLRKATVSAAINGRVTTMEIEVSRP